MEPRVPPPKRYHNIVVITLAPIKVLSVRASRAIAALCPLAVALSPYAWLALLQGQDNADVAKNFALEHKLDQEGMQNVYYFLNRKAAEGGFYKKKLDVKKDKKH